MGRKRVRFFVSYARANQQLVDVFVGLMKDQFGPAKRYRYELWKDSNIHVGEDWHQRIQKALEACDLGLLLVSLSFLQSQYIEETELPRFVGDESKPVIPVLLQTVDLARHDLKGLEKQQIFRLEDARFSSPKSFYDCTKQQRERFARVLYGRIEDRLDDLYGP